MRFILTLAMALAAGSASAQSFSCNIGQPACLDYGAVVCDSTAKCVSDNAVCFNSYTCDFKGFVCKSDMDDVIEKHDEIVTKYNALAEAVDDVQRCVGNAIDVNDAQSCFRRLP